MMELQGKYNTAKIFTNNVESTAIGQIIEMLNNKITKEAQVRIMPDVHAGKGSTVGTTIQLPENFDDWKVSPNVVGVDVGCGVLMYKIDDKDIDLQKLDEVVNKKVPAGFNIHMKPQNHSFTNKIFKELTFEAKDKIRISKSLGTLGGGNHFIELGVDEDGFHWLSVHSGSRGLGVQVAKHHQDIAVENIERGKVDIDDVIEKLKSEGRHNEIQRTIEDIKSNTSKLTQKEKELAYLDGDKLKDYLTDMTAAQKYAAKSRETMLDIIVRAMGFNVIDKFDSVHNFIEHNQYRDGIVRKGATSAKKGERLVIPLNMRDGSIIAEGKGNDDWNNSAPHGAGRTMSRRQAKEKVNLDDFKETMKGVYSSSVGESTLDEAPDAYKPADEIKDNIEDTAKVLHIVKPIYNFKAH